MEKYLIKLFPMLCQLKRNDFCSLNPKNNCNSFNYAIEPVLIIMNLIFCF